MLSLLKRFIRKCDGNVAIITALAAIPLCYLAGMGVDYGTAVDRQTQLDSIADAAALSAVTPTMMAQSTSVGVTEAQNTFNGQASALTQITYSSANLTVTVSTAGLARTVTVAYTAKYNTFFPTLLGASTIALSGTSTATGGMAPNINFYLLLDSSPSMAIAATQAGINTMVSNTSSQGGCAFGCHESHPSSDSLGNPGGEDNYALARALGVTLRIDLLNQAAQNLMTTAQSTESSNNAHYQMAIYSFDTGFNTLQTMTSNLSTAKTSAAGLSMLEVYSNNNLTQYTANNDEDTNYDNAMSSLNSAMPNPGSGTNNAGDTPQEVVFLVTDGVEDECQTPTLNSYSGGGCRQQYLMNSNTDYCSAIKNRGIRIAIVYTEYLPLPTNAWYMNFDGAGAGITSFQPNIATQLQTCASPGLYYEVTTGGDISAALASLFQYAVQSAYLSK